MASKSDGKSGKRIRYSSMKQPPLIKQLKGILSEYPDGGQILKELIQNAEDAEAREVKVLYDRRKMNDRTGETTPVFTKFFKGPALCVYNDAVFSERDWEGIQMIYSSVKEEDPLKVGRFGLGFKSVFHMTDFPCVLSGDRVLLIDPQQPPEKVNATIMLNEVEGLDRDDLDPKSFWKAFTDLFGITKHIIKRGYYEGTILRFPLRDRPSKLSDTLYNEHKVMSLFDSFQSESSSILIFLQSLESISISVRKNENRVSRITAVEIKDNMGKIREKRDKYKQEIKRNKKDVKCEHQMTLNTITNGKSEITEWLVVNYLPTEDLSPEFDKLVKDTSLGYSPSVGVAAPLSQSSNAFEGHIFCFLPLPREGSRLTGLPVHVNGYFALSQNRHHLKWETDEQHGKKIDDKSILWNQFLISEALPRAYEALIQAVIEWSRRNNNNPTSATTVYRCMPTCTRTKERWKILERALYKKLKQGKFLYHSFTNE